MNSRYVAVIALSACVCAVAPAESLSLSMEQAVAAALERNFTVRISELDPRVARAEVRRAAGLFDPVVTSEYSYQRDEIGAFEIDEEAAVWRIGVGSTLPWGTQWEAFTERNDRTTPLDPYTGGYSDGVTSFTGVVVTQPVLRGFGLAGSYSAVRIARAGAAAAWEDFRDQVMGVVEDTVTAYQDLYFAQEALRIAMRNRDLALQLLRDNRKRVETGAMAPLDIVQAESEAALREVSVISAKAAVRQAGNALKGLVWNDPQTVLDLDLEILPPPEPVYFEPLLARDLPLALQARPDYQVALFGLDSRQTELGQLRRNALPQLDIIGSAGRHGNDAAEAYAPGYLYQDGDMSYSIGAVLSLPFPNRTRSAERTQAYLRRNQAQLAVQQLEQAIRLDLDDAAAQLNADWQNIQAARTARELAEKSLQAEEKKLQAGTSTTFVVLRLQGDLATAEIREINALADYTVSLARYHRARGQLLEVHGIRLSREG